MTSGQRDQPGRPREQSGVLRLALPALLVLLVLAGLRGVAGTSGWAGHYTRDGVVIGVALEAVLAVLLVVLAVRARRAPKDALVAARLRGMLFYLLAAAAIAIPLVLLFGHLHPNGRPGTQRPLPEVLPHLRKQKALPTRSGTTSTFPFDDVLYGLLVALLLAAVIVCWVLLARRKRHGPAAEPGPDLDDEPADLRAAVESGRDALRRLDDARAAIIACYAAMEQSLARAGAARAVADTPDELLARAVDAGLARGPAAARLTVLFYEARFSSHPLGRGERDAAEQALTAIAADLARPPADPAPDAPASTDAPAGAGGAGTSGGTGGGMGDQR
jgi:tetrahydromethanopterin S-methyltransferase subunit B